MATLEYSVPALCSGREKSNNNQTGFEIAHLVVIVAVLKWWWARILVQSPKAAVEDDSFCSTLEGPASFYIFLSAILSRKVSRKELV